MRELKDTSIFQGVVQFETEAGETYRASKTEGFLKGKRCQLIYRLSGDSYIFFGTIHTNAKTPRGILSAIEKAGL